MSHPNPHNPRQRVEHVAELVDPDNPQRDGSVLPHDHSLTKMANVIKYMRQHEFYLPPNPWPEAMLLYGLNKEGCLNCAFIMRLDQFETIPTETLFSLCNKDTVKLYFAPFPKMPPTNEIAQQIINQWLNNTNPEEFQRQTLYLDVNEWWVGRP